MLFEKEIREAEDKIYNKRGYVVCNMADNQNEFEIYDRNEKVLIDHLSVAQLEQLAEIL